MDQFIQQHAIITEIPVAWGEMDALNHVNNVVYFRYFETARIDFFSQINMMADLKETAVGPVLSETHARYKRPVTFPDTLLVSVNISDVKENRFIMHYRIFSKAQQVVTTTGTANVVMFNFKTGQKAKLTPELLAALEQHKVAE
ncbi:thioesterase family protein [Shewanella sp. 1_MG-2023]|uniref:acyl-CoA thioesterase n=1 Tax=unclassified Shewanella TaxID=196818 RepID=UPI0026E1DEE4|nr:MULTISPECIES: thioesterase family protein [unclassified Shewanella]MDO6612747.1 thioesterase family protein [Shewanella sp. 7_MG-2023]MDO6772708.1 thioesterase family protein [Shewanella sp. 2_MG-2023]MDO6794872.1 thioesterase family protein [Shewanella sp. 1_MG-2023]